MPVGIPVTTPKLSIAFTGEFNLPIFRKFGNDFLTSEKKSKRVATALTTLDSAKNNHIKESVEVGDIGQEVDENRLRLLGHTII